MKIKYIEIEGFRSFAKKTKLKFPDGPGLFIVRGQNLLEPALGANGSGKSTVFDALVWCLYGKTTRGLYGPSVESWSTDDPTIVTVQFATHVVTRGRRPNTLSLDGQIVEQPAVDDTVGMTFDRFTQTVVLPQFGSLFPDMKPTARLDLVSSVLDLEVWSAASRVAVERLARFGREMVDAERVLHGIEAKKQTLIEQQQQLNSERLTWADKHREQIEQTKVSLGEANATASEAAAHLTFLRTEMDEATATRDSYRKELSAIVTKKHALKVEHATKRAEVSHIATEMSEAHQEEDDVEADLLDKSCPTCFQPVSAEQIETVLAAIDVAITEIESRHAQAKKELRSLEDEIDAVDKEFRKRDAACDKREQDAVAATDAHVTQQRAVDRTMERVKSWKNKLKALQDEDNPLEHALEEITDKLDDIDEDIEDAEMRYYEAVTHVDLVKEWPVWFKHLRLWLIDTTLNELTMRVNNALVTLGLVGWEINFVIERETKAGTVSKGFEILVRSPASPAGVPWEAWSGGETQRLRVACATGLAELIRLRNPRTPAVEVWDEPTAHLDREGVRDLAQFFKDRSVHRQVWLVDHRALDGVAEDGSVLVVKDKAGSSLQSSF